MSTAEKYALHVHIPSVIKILFTHVTVECVGLFGAVPGCPSSHPMSVVLQNVMSPLISLDYFKPKDS